MRKFKNTLYGACLLFVASIITTPLSAGSLSDINWSDPFGVSGGGAAGSVGGPSIAISAAGNAGVLEGSGQNSQADVSSGSLGKLYGSVGVGLGYAIPVGEAFLLGIDLRYQPGSGKIVVDAGVDDTGGDNSTNEDVNLEMGGSRSVSIMPMFAVSDNSAFYIRAGRELVDLAWSGDVQDATLNSSMRADTLAVGSRTLIGTHAFVQTEFGYNDFGSMYVDTKISDSNATVDTENIYGSFSIGVKY